MFEIISSVNNQLGLLSFYTGLCWSVCSAIGELAVVRRGLPNKFRLLGALKRVVSVLELERDGGSERAMM
jgi:hypothetical protein